MTPYYQDDLVTIYHGAAADVMADLPGTVDLIFTDPPYPLEFDSVWDDLATGSAALLRPGGSLLTYLGHYQLPRVMVAFKPVLWYTQGQITGRSLMSDELSYVPKGITGRKKMHIWGQPLSYLPIVRLTEPGDVVLDPFMGSGTVLVAAKDAGRRAIGIEIEERYCEVAATRCSQEVLGLVS